jgi:hypothetical protein
MEVTESDISNFFQTLSLDQYTCLIQLSMKVETLLGATTAFGHC